MVAGRTLVSTFDKAIETGRKAIKNRRTALLLLVCLFMAISSAGEEILAHHYVTVLFAFVFFLIVAPWFGWNYIKPQE